MKTYEYPVDTLVVQKLVDKWNEKYHMPTVGDLKFLAECIYKELNEPIFP